MAACPFARYGCTVVPRDISAHLQTHGPAHCELVLRELEVERQETALHRQSLSLAQTRCAELEDGMRQLRQQLAHLPALLQLQQMKDRIIMVCMCVCMCVCVCVCVF
jgi:hypothetical protein